MLPLSVEKFLEMKPIFCTLIAVLLSTGYANAAKISVETARQEAISFFKKKHLIQNDSVVKQTDSKTDAYYIFCNDKQDCVIISGSDKTRQTVLGSSSNFTGIDKMPAALKWILANYKKQIAAAEADHTLPGYSNHMNGLKKYVPQNEKESIAPFIQTTWYQDLYYGDTLSGCIATSMSQVMNYYQHPATPSKTIPSFSDGNKTYDALPVTTFDWKVIGNFSNDSTMTSFYEIAKLMKYCGHATEMKYGVTASGTYAGKIAPALKNFFDYDSETRYVEKKYFTEAEWEELIYDELKNARPVIMGGCPDTSDIGHSFICDGYYAADNTFHLNFGWNGEYDGFYSLTSIVPGDQNLSFDQDAVVGIKPGTFKKQKTNDTELQITKIDVFTSYTTNATVSIDVWVKNCGDKPYEGDIYMKQNGFINSAGPAMVNGVLRDPTKPFTIAPNDSARLFYNTMFYEGYDPLHMDFSSSDGVLLAQKELKTYVYTTNTAHIKSNIKICNAYDSTLVAGIMQYHIKPGKNKAVLTIENNDTVPFRDLIHLYRTVNSTSVVDTLRVNGDMLTIVPGDKVTFYYEFNADTKDNGFGGFKLTRLNARAHWTARQYAYYCVMKMLDGQHAMVDTIFDSLAPADALWIDLSSFDAPQIEDVDLTQVSANCICYASCPTLTQKSNNIVANGVCNQLTIDGNQDFYLRSDITANEASFTKTFANASDAYSWNAIFLPFAADSAFLPDGTEVLKSGLMKIYNIRGFNGNTISYAADQQLRPGCGYLIGVPAQSGDLTTVTFKGHNVSVAATNDLRLVSKKSEFIGSTMSFENLGKSNYFSAYTFDPETFSFTEEEEIMGKIDPFTICFYTDSFEESFGLDDVSADQLIKSDYNATGKIFTPLGQYIGTFKVNDFVNNGTNRRIYITNGRKFVR